jgi:SAM-dependent methyltransferase
MHDFHYLARAILMKRPNWNHRYTRGEHVADPPLRLLITTAEGLAAGTALDLACGPGRHSLALARLGWAVTAVDSSPIAVGLLRDRAQLARVSVDVRLADLEKHEFRIPAGAYDLICQTFYLQRDLFPEIRDGLRPGGVFLGVIHGEDSSAPDMNQAFLLRPGELQQEFAGWEILHHAEAVPQAGHRRLATEIVCRKPS